MCSAHVCVSWYQFVLHGAPWIFLKLCASYPGGSCNVVRKCTVSEIQNLTLWCPKLQANWIISKPVWVMTVAARLRNENNDKTTCSVVVRELFFLFLFSWLNVGSCSGHNKLVFTLIYWTLQVWYKYIHMYLVTEPLLTTMTVMMLTVNKLLYTLKMAQDKLELKN